VAAAKEGPLPKVEPKELDAALAAALAGDEAPLRRLLAHNSNLPGPRGNLELAWQFADAVAARAGGPSAEGAWRVSASLASVSPEEGPTNDPEEFLAFCGTVAAAGFAAAPRRRPEVWAVIRAAAEDPRWRLREGAAQAIQRALPLDPGGLSVLGEWADEGSWLMCRAVVAGLADPPLLEDGSLAAEALALHQTVLARLAAAPDRRDPDFRVLRQGLGYTLSVVVAALPDEGFALLERFAASRDGDLAWVLRSNLGKGRLARPYPERVAAVHALLGG
jgi:hypothetical protein